MILSALSADAWFTSQASGLIFGLSGAVMGLLGGVLGIIGIRRIPRAFGVKILIGLFVLFGCSAAVGLLALLGVNQPYHVWYPFLMFGAVGMFVIGITWITWKRAYSQLEQSQLDSKLLRDEWPTQGH